MHSEYCNTLVLRPRLRLNCKIFSIGIGIVIEFLKQRYWYWYLYWFSESGVLILKLVSILEIWNINIDIGIETWFFRIKYRYWLFQAGIAHLWGVSWSNRKCSNRDEMFLWKRKFFTYFSYKSTKTHSFVLHMISRKSVEVTIPNTNLSSIPCDRNGASVAKVRTSLFYLYFSYVMKTLDVISFRQGRRVQIYTCVPMHVLTPCSYKTK